MNSIIAWNLGGQEMIIVFLIVLLLFGAKKLPQLARGVGKSMGEFKRARDEFEHEITRAEHEEREKKPKTEKKEKKPKAEKKSESSAEG